MKANKRMNRVSKQEILEMMNIITSAMAEPPDFTSAMLNGWSIALQNIPGATDYHLQLATPKLLEDLHDFPSLKQVCDAVKSTRPFLTWCSECSTNCVAETGDRQYTCLNCGREYGRKDD